ncbi:MAG: hypothetical protein AB1765_09630 [Candidatus Hydrogenedentota bacterium]
MCHQTVEKILKAYWQSRFLGEKPEIFIK